MGAAVLFASTAPSRRWCSNPASPRCGLPRHGASARSGLGLIVLLDAPGSLRTDRRELAFLAVFGVCGVALVQLFYFAAIARLEIGSPAIQYTAPLLVALWARFVFKERVRSRVGRRSRWRWSAFRDGRRLGRRPAEHGRRRALAYFGCNVRGLPAASEHAVGRRDPLSLSSTAFSSPACSGPSPSPGGASRRDEFSETSRCSGTSAPPSSRLGARAGDRRAGDDRPVHAHGRLAPAPACDHRRHGAMLEPVLGALVAYLWLDESLAAQQLAGGAIVLVAIFLAQTVTSTPGLFTLRAPPL